jgi:nucleoside 2-deoxyribosyltransferase
MARVYCAGPLFNQAERDEMGRLAAILEAAGHSTFLPHRDGLEFAPLLSDLEANSVSRKQATATLQRAIFALDLHKLLIWADAAVVNFNGRVPDEGVVVEAALAWHSKKALVVYKADVRTVLEGADNPMLAGLAGWHTVTDLQHLPQAVDEQLRAPRQDRVISILETGRQIQELREANVSRILLAKHLHAQLL